jgi:hypothetical protein
MAYDNEKTVADGTGSHEGSNDHPDLAERGKINSEEHHETLDEQRSHMSRWTRMGVTPASFKRRVIVGEDNQLNQTVKMRHLHMIGECYGSS